MAIVLVTISLLVSRLIVDFASGLGESPVRQASGRKIDNDCNNRLGKAERNLASQRF